MESLTWNDVRELDNPLILDVRSPREYYRDHIPGAINLPVLTNDQHEEVGTIHNNEGGFRARQVGARKITENLPSILRWIERHHDPERPIVVSCWRGGNRSYSLGVVLDSIGYDTYRLKGGYKAYRSHVNDSLRESKSTRKFITICGYTGAGKTSLLERLDQHDIPVVNLEAAANHRGSTFGGVDLPDQPTQKQFESRLHHRMESLQPPYVTEGESQFIGSRQIPRPTFEAIAGAPKLWLETEHDQRVERILDDYDGTQNRQILRSQIENLNQRIGANLVTKLQEQLDAGNIRNVVHTLLEQYYDPAYEKSGPAKHECKKILNGKNLSEAEQQVTDFRQALV